MTDLSQLPDKALSIRQPWAWAITFAGKDIENRDWPTKFRGPVCIHAAKGCTRREYFDALEFIRSARKPEFKMSPPGRSILMRASGGIIGTAEIVDCVEASDSPWFMGRYGFVLQNVRPISFIPVKGALSFFNWKPRISMKLEGI